MFEWITGFVEQAGYLGIALLMFLENVFPPIPSELIMPLAGFSARQGDLAIVPVILAGTAGSLAGALFWYGIGRVVGIGAVMRFAERHGRWLTLAPRDVERAEAWFREKGGLAVLVGRLIPAVRTLISIPAGVSRMPLGRFLLYTTLGTAAWTAFLALAGYALASRYALVEQWLGPVSNGVIALIVLVYLYRVATFSPKRAAQTEPTR